MVETDNMAVICGWGKIKERKKYLGFPVYGNYFNKSEIFCILPIENTHDKLISI